MKNISIISFINTIFLIAIIFVSISFKLFLDADINRYHRIVNSQYNIMANAFLTDLELIPTDEQINKIMVKYDVKKLNDEKLKMQIIREQKEFLIIKSDQGESRVRIFRIDEDYYIYVQKFGYNLFFIDNSPKIHHYIRNNFMIIIMFTMIVLLYLLLIQKLKPLKILKENVDRFADGDLSIREINMGNDEIGEISKSFNSAVLSINKLIESKNLFMRNMMHELKTPVTKGMIIAEMVIDGNNKDILHRVFERINEIINQLATIEKLNFNLLKLNIKENSLKKMLYYSVRILIIDEKRCEMAIDNINLKVDKELFVMVLKNLIHNGIKFSKDDKVYINLENNKLLFSSYSPPLIKPLEYYLEPFSQEEKRQDGLGLGLYVINSILKVHNLHLEYQYSQQKVIFKIDITNIISKSPNGNIGEGT